MIDIDKFCEALRRYEHEKGLVMWLVGGTKDRGRDVYAFDIYELGMDPDKVDFIHPDAVRLWEDAQDDI